MISVIEVRLREHLPDPRGVGVEKGIQDLGIEKPVKVRVRDLYWLEGSPPPAELEKAARGLLADPITHQYALNPAPETKVPARSDIIVTFNAGVADPVEQTVLKALGDMGIKSITAVRSAQHYVIQGELSPAELTQISSRLLINPIVQHAVTEAPAVFPESPRYVFKLKEIPLLSCSDEELLNIGRSFTLNKEEIRAAAAYFRKLGRNPTDAEMETLSQTWSEHCVHKTFKARYNFNGQVISNLMKDTIMRATRELNLPWCLSVFKDNAGVIEFDDDWAVCFKVETHNHPSAIEPYGGAATGIGGVVRDILGTGLGAKPIANTDVFAFGPPDLPYEALPEGLLHPKRIFKGVRAGVADYGNRLGIPTLNGTVLFDQRYTANPLVFCGTVGLMPKDVAGQGRQSPGDLVVVVGGRTGRDGIRGVTFASEQLTGDSTDLCMTSVQIGNAIVEKKVLDGLLKCRDQRLFSRITDCGGGGFSSAIGEMGEETGVKVYLDRAPLKYSGLSYSEIWISESQERMLLAVPPEKLDELLAIFASEDSEATVIGEFTDDKKLTLYYQDSKVASLDMEFLHGGRSQLELTASWHAPAFTEPELPEQREYNQDLLSLLSAWNICSKEWVIRQYDHEVQGASVLKPMVGKTGEGPGDAAIIRPVAGSPKGLVISNGVSIGFGDLDPYWMTASAIDEALRQVIAVGGSLERVAILDNFCWGNVREPESLGALVRACQACYDFAVAYGTPFISGKDSLNNEFEHNGRKISIPHTVLISALAVMEDYTRAVTSDLKAEGNLIYLAGITKNELGGSEYYKLLGHKGINVPRVDAAASLALMRSISLATAAGLVRACHDLSEGGLGVALAEMAIGGELGAEIDLRCVASSDDAQHDARLLFSESNSRFLIEVAPEKQAAFEALLSGRCQRIGKVQGQRVIVSGLEGHKVIDAEVGALKEAWQKPIRW
jgi:phosphoribosylformylglycinamidine synthase